VTRQRARALIGRAAVHRASDAYDKAVKACPAVWLEVWWAGWCKRVGPKGSEYGRFSIDFHFTRNGLGAPHAPEKADQHLPARQKNHSATAFRRVSKTQHLRSRPRGACGVPCSIHAALPGTSGSWQFRGGGPL